MKIKINGLEIPWNQSTITYEQICVLTNISEEYHPTITYEAKNSEGFLRKNASIEITEGTRIYCGITGDA